MPRDGGCGQTPRTGPGCEPGADVGDAWLGQGEKFSFRGCIRRPWEALLGQRYRRTRGTAASKGGYLFAADDQGKEECTLLSTFNL
jgi:hypothetical protein